jgi:aspartyl-tRNA(Asn)/glutamyl-tRNA(Gln) amidotransferase subunit A
MSELFWKSAFELAAMIRRKELKASELMEATLAQIEALNPKINAFCALRAEQAMNEARALDERIAAGAAPGLLAGLPLGVKDLEDVAGMPTTFGSVPFKNHMPEHEEIQVTRLKAAGAIVTGKTNTPEFGHTAFTRNLLFGVTRNPWNPERTPGGSSGGSAAAIAAGMTPLATGSDAGGSIRIPASYTGCFGFKPSHGRIPASARLGMIGWIDTASLGPIVRTVRDAAMYMDATVGYHPLDPDSLPHPGISYMGALERLPKNLRIAFHRDFGHPVQGDVMREVEMAAGAFREFGYELEILDESVPETGEAWQLIDNAQKFASIADYIEGHRSEFGRAFLASVESGGKTSWRDYGRAQRTRNQFNQWAQRIFERFDLLLTPTVATEAFGASGPPPREIDGHPLTSPLEALVFTYPFNLSGHPAASVRAGMTDNGLPCGLQIVADRHRDDLVLQAAYAYEQARPWNRNWPSI